MPQDQELLATAASLELGSGTGSEEEPFGEQHGRGLASRWPVARAGLLLVPVLLVCSVLAATGNAGLPAPPQAAGPVEQKYGSRRKITRLRRRTAREAGVPDIIGLSETPGEEDNKCVAPESDSLSHTWSKLSEKEKAAAVALGWKKEDWNCDGEDCARPPVWESGWEDLSDDEKKSMAVLGWNKLSWDYPQTVDADWDDLSKEEQSAAEVLGWDSKTWDCRDDDCDAPETEDRRWGELGDDKKAAAEDLGWTQELWDKCWVLPESPDAA